MRRFMRDEIPAAAEVLKHDGCIAAATDTVFGVCARISEEGQRKLYEVKNRPQTKRFPVMCADAEQLRAIAEVSPAAEAVIGGQGARPPVMRASEAPAGSLRLSVRTGLWHCR